GGVLCKHGGRVTELNLQGLDLVGTISPHLGNLSALRSLCLQNNHFVGNIPNQIGSLVFPQPSQSIPSTITNCTNPMTMDLSTNIISGTIPSSIHHLHKLGVLKIGANQLDGSIPPSISNLSWLKTLDVHTNNLIGKIPEELGRLNNIQQIQLSINNLEGIVPGLLYNQSTLSLIGFAVNDLHGQIQFLCIYSRLPNLRLFHICINKFNGTIPPSLHNLTKIESIRMSHNFLSSSVPPGLSRLGNLVLYNIGFNQIADNASILVELTNCTKLQLLFDRTVPVYLGGNKISGQIPLLNMSHNLTVSSISGSISPDIGQLTELTKLLLNWNELSGPITIEIGNLTSLTTLEISKKEIVSRITDELGHLHHALSLDLSSNNLHGHIPASLFAISSLNTILNLSNNSLTGALAENIGQLKKTNQLTGDIPASLANLQALQLLNLSMNDLNGLVPCTGIFANHSAVHLDGNQMLCYSSLTCYNHHRKLHVMIAVAVAAASAAAISILILKFLKLLPRRHLAKAKTRAIDILSELCRVTNTFDQTNLIGVGSFGSVYKAVHVGTAVAVKVLDLHKMGAPKSWVLDALEYMHNDCGGQAVHCDTKPSDVLLDGDMTAKVGDFGVTRLMAPVQLEQQSISSVQGLTGSIVYNPPEYGYEGKPSPKGVYSYGVMLLEMITGRSPLQQTFREDMNLAKWVRENLPHEARQVIDQRLISSTLDASVEGVQRSRAEHLLPNCLLIPMMEVALSCVVESPYERSGMHDCLLRLKKLKETFLHNRRTIYAAGEVDRN
ncbi:hypothetical protein BDA96_10G203400, partial [Sorghum bicolor]